MPTEMSGSILVVDDNPATRYATSRVLRHAGFSVREAATGTEGIVAASAKPTDLVVLDIDLPDINGYEVCRRIRTLPSTQRVRVVYLSASFIDDNHKVQGFEAGADGFLSHPVEPAVLNATVASLLRTRTIEMELEQLLERERQARAEAERANRAKDDFLATLSHELRSPLTAIVGWAEVARIQAEQHPDILNAVMIIARNAKLQAQLISDLLDVSRITTGNLRLETTTLSLGDVVESIAESMAAIAAERGIKLDVKIDEEVCLVQGDVGRLHQIVGNVLSNALKFSNAGSTVHLTLTCEESGFAKLIVEDHGQGIGPAVLRRIFDRFWQEDTSSRRSHGGLGLGLSIVKHLVEMHGGTVVAESEGEAKGAKFTIRLPISAGDAPPTSTASTSGEFEEADTPISLAGLRVLLLDDETDGREWVRHIVTLAGAAVMDVSDVTQALVAVEAFAPDVIVSDLAMPQRNGFDFIRELRDRGHKAAELPVVALSAFASAEDKARALEAGFQHFLSKPPESRELLRVLRRLGR